MKLASMANEAGFNRQRSLLRWASKLYSFLTVQWKFSGDKHKSLQVYTERTFHQRYPLVML